MRRRHALLLLTAVLPLWLQSCTGETGLVVFQPVGPNAKVRVVNVSPVSISVLLKRVGRGRAVGLRKGNDLPDGELDHVGCLCKISNADNRVRISDPSATGLSTGVVGSPFSVTPGQQHVRLTGSETQTVLIDDGNRQFIPNERDVLVIAPPASGASGPRTLFWGAAGC